MSAEVEGAVQVLVFVPEDRLRDFQVSLPALLTGGDPPAVPGSTAKNWTPFSVTVSADSAVRFYEAFGRWLEVATANPQPGRPKPAVTREDLVDIWAALPAQECEGIGLMSDAWGRAVSWAELCRKMGLVGDPSLARDFPSLVRECEQRGKAVPVRQHGSDSKAVFTLDDALIGAARALARPTPRRSTED
jgi:hypothetical protein